MSILSQNPQYSKTSRQWIVVTDEGVFLTYPAGPAGKHAATIAAMTLTSPALVAEIDALTQRHPALASRALNGGLIVAAGGVELLHLNHYRVQSQSRPETHYIVSNFAAYSPQWRCDCMDYHNSSYFHVWGFSQYEHLPKAPFINGSPICKHICACIEAANVSPVETCQVCAGNCYTGFTHSGITGTAHAATAQAIPCPACKGTGCQPVGEFNFLDDPDYCAAFAQLEPRVRDFLTYEIEL